MPICHIAMALRTTTEVGTKGIIWEVGLLRRQVMPVLDFGVMSMQRLRCCRCSVAS